MQVMAIDVHTVKTWLDHQDVLLIDVREPAEFASQKIAQAKLYSQALDAQIEACQGDQKIVVYCQKGMRGQSACKRFIEQHANLTFFNLEGGLEAWAAAGLPVEQGNQAMMPLMQQVQLIIGLAVVGFGLMAYFVAPFWVFGAVFFGAGLINAGLTGWCGLAKLVGKMPWNQTHSAKF